MKPCTMACQQGSVECAAFHVFKSLPWHPPETHTVDSWRLRLPLITSGHLEDGRLLTKAADIEKHVCATTCRSSSKLTVTWTYSR